MKGLENGDVEEAGLPDGDQRTYGGGFGNVTSGALK